MQLSWIGATTAAIIVALPTIAAPNTAAAAEARASMPAAQPLPRRAPAVVEHHVDLNRASSQELMTLPGIGADEARRIIANRPYRTKSELVTKNVLEVGPFLSVRRYVVALPGTAPRGKS